MRRCYEISTNLRTTEAHCRGPKPSSFELDDSMTSPAFYTSSLLRMLADPLDISNWFGGEADCRYTVNVIRLHKLHGEQTRSWTL